MKLTKLLRKADQLKNPINGITEINQHCILIKKGAKISNHPGKLMPDKFYPLNWEEFKQGIRFGHTFEADQILVSGSARNISIHAAVPDYSPLLGKVPHLLKPRTESFNHRFAGKIPELKTALSMNYLWRLVALPKEETKSVSWGFISMSDPLSLQGNDVIHIPVFRFKSFYWYQMPCEINE